MSEERQYRPSRLQGFGEGLRRINTLSEKVQTGIIISTFFATWGNINYAFYSTNPEVNLELCPLGVAAIIYLTARQTR